jgi:ParB family chromosome partitioning protein
MKIEYIIIEKLLASKINPRLAIEAGDLAKSIAAEGVLVPLIVRRVGPARYTILAGHRRAAAAKIAGLADVPCIVEDKATAPRDALIHLVENEQRENLRPVEKAIAVRAALAESGGKQRDLAKASGKSEKWVSMFNTIGKYYEQQSEEIKAKMAEFTDADQLYAFCKPAKLVKGKQRDLVDEAAEQERQQDESALQQKVAEYMQTTFDNVSVAIDPSGNCVVAINFATMGDADRFFTTASHFVAQRKRLKDQQ